MCSVWVRNLHSRLRRLRAEIDRERKPWWVSFTLSSFPKTWISAFIYSVVKTQKSQTSSDVWDFLRPAHRNEPIGSTARCFRANVRQWRETPLVLPSRRNKHRGGTQADKAAGVFLYSFPLIHSVHMTQPLESFCFQGIFICRSCTSKHNFFCICRCM